MTSTRHRLAALLVLSCILAPVRPVAAAAYDLPDPVATQEAWLVTYGPGEVYWQRFGHNAIWLREPALGLNHVFNSGYFDFRQERFLARFIRGRMLYFTAAQEAEREFDAYARDDRSISAQKLALSPEQYLRVRDHLLETVQPENRDYLYDYFTDNCSTRVRDVIDLALDGALSGHFTQRPARLNFREQTRRLTAMDFWYYLGLEAGLGSPVDRPRDRWEEMFIPGVLADSLVGLSLAETAGPAAGERLLLYASSRAEPAADPPDVWSRYLLLGILLAAAAWASGRFLSTVLGEGLLLAWALLAGTAGCVLAGLWGLTDHHAAGSNVNLLLFLPLALLAPLRAPKKVVAVLMLAATVTAAMLALVPGGQYNLDVLAFAAPLNLVCSALLWRGPALFGQR